MCGLAGIFFSVWVQQFSHSRLGTEKGAWVWMKAPPYSGFAFSLVFLLTRNYHT